MFGNTYLKLLFLVSLFRNKDSKKVFLVSLFPKQEPKKCVSCFLVSETHAKIFVSCFFVSETTGEKWCFLFPVSKQKQRNLIQLFRSKCFLPISDPNPNPMKSNKDKNELSKKSLISVQYCTYLAFHQWHRLDPPSRMFCRFQFAHRQKCTHCTRPKRNEPIAGLR